MTKVETTLPEATGTNKIYFAAWRRHFYAGLSVIPFFAILAITGMAMPWIAWIDGRDGERTPVVSQDALVAISARTCDFGRGRV